MQLRTLGKTGLLVSELGLGCARIGGIFQQDSADFSRLIASARDAGINFFDTADIYSQGESEALLGRSFRGSRRDVVIASKAGYCLPAQRKLIARIKPLARPVIRLLGLKREKLPAAVRGTVTQDFSPAYLVAAVDASLRRLQTDYLDLLQLHSPPADVVARGDWLLALDGLKQKGKIRHYGVSVDTVEAGLAALEHAGVETLQFRLSLIDREPVPEILPKLVAKNVGGIARECFAGGQLVKSEAELDLSRFVNSPEEQQARALALASCRAQAAERGVSLVSLALDYALNAQGVSVALIGARTPAQLAGILAAKPQDAAPVTLASV